MRLRLIYHPVTYPCNTTLLRVNSLPLPYSAVYSSRCPHLTFGPHTLFSSHAVAAHFTHVWCYTRPAPTRYYCVVHVATHVLQPRFDVVALDTERSLPVWLVHVYLTPFAVLAHTLIPRFILCIFRFCLPTASSTVIYLLFTFYHSLYYTYPTPPLVLVDRILHLRCGCWFALFTKFWLRLPLPRWFGCFTTCISHLVCGSAFYATRLYVQVTGWLFFYLPWVLLLVAPPPTLCPVALFAFWMRTGLHI